MKTDPAFIKPPWWWKVLMGLLLTIGVVFTGVLIWAIVTVVRAVTS